MLCLNVWKSNKTNEKMLLSSLHNPQPSRGLGIFHILSLHQWLREVWGKESFQKIPSSKHFPPQFFPVDFWISILLQPAMPCQPGVVALHICQWHLQLKTTCRNAVKATSARAYRAVRSWPNITRMSLKSMIFEAEAVPENNTSLCHESTKSLWICQFLQKDSKHLLQC